MWRPIVRAAATTCLRSADPSSSGGVPTAMNCTCPCATLSAGSVVNRSRPAAAFRSTSSGSPGSWIGTSPAFRAAIFRGSTSKQSTSLPTSAKHAPETRPT